METIKGIQETISESPSKYVLITVFSGWVVFIIYIFTYVEYDGYSFRIIERFLSTDLDAISFRALMLCVPFISTVLGYMAYKRTRLNGIAVEMHVRFNKAQKVSAEMIKRQLERQRALRTIDMAISSSLDLNLTLDIFLEQVKSQLKVDSADVLLLNPNTRILEYAAAKGFRTERIRHISLRLGDSYAGHIAKERKKLIIPDLSKSEYKFPHSSKYEFTQARLIKEENIKAYFGMPLIAKGYVKGILEIFQRSPFEPDEEWLEFLESLASQAAIALDNALMFNDLQNSRDELVVAYDATIEGWSRALDYRDKETEGHSERVTEMTLNVAREIGMSGEVLTHIRRGALLHDIGKLGVPDRILFKPGKLTAEEWNIMKKHPVIAHELLSPIPFLRPSIHIPYCHHERWDGTGYPRGLKGEKIPIEARIFAIIDVWDALSSDRPYRPAWSEPRIYEYIISESGKHFDPGVVGIFMGQKPKLSF